MSYKSGLYASVWASSVNFQSEDNANLELDTSGGFVYKFNDGPKIDIGVTYYTYPCVATEKKWNYGEFYVQALYKIDSLGISGKYSYSSDYGGINPVVPSNQSAYYVESAFTYDLPYEVVAAIHCGNTGGKHYQDTRNQSNHRDLSFGLSKDVVGYGVDLSIYGTDQNGRKLSGANADNQWVLKIS